MQQRRIAIDSGDGITRYGFIVSEVPFREACLVRFLTPRGRYETEVPRKHILGVVGKTFFPSMPARPDVCERVIFFDRGFQRKGWVKDVEHNGRVALFMGDEVVGRWAEELVLFPIGCGHHKLSEEEIQELGVSSRQDDGDGAPEKKGGNGEVVMAELFKVAERGSEEVNALLAEMANL